jgi:hypothetical protein
MSNVRPGPVGAIEGPATVYRVSFAHNGAGRPFVVEVFRDDEDGFTRLKLPFPAGPASVSHEFSSPVVVRRGRSLYWRTEPATDVVIEAVVVPSDKVALA